MGKFYSCENDGLVMLRFPQLPLAFDVLKTWKILRLLIFGNFINKC